MPGPWEDYQQPARPPWEDYGGKAMPVKFEGSTTPAQGPWNDYSKLAGGSEAKIQAAPGYLQSLIEEVTAPFQATPETQAGVAPPPMERINRALQFFNSPFAALSRGTTKYAGENLPVSPTQAEAVGQGVAAVAQGAMLPWRSRVQLAPARTIESMIPNRVALPPPTEQLALPPANQRGLPPPAPERMVMEAGPAGIQQAPKRTIVDLVDEVKQDVKAQVVDELVQELRTGRNQRAAAAQPPRTAQQLIEAPRQQIEPPKNPIYEVNPQGEAAATSFRPLPREAITPAPVEQLFTQAKPEGLKAGVTKAAEPRAAALDFMNQYKASKGLTPEAGLTPPRPIEDVLPKQPQPGLNAAQIDELAAQHAPIPKVDAIRLRHKLPDAYMPEGKNFVWSENKAAGLKAMEAEGLQLRQAKPKVELPDEPPFDVPAAEPAPAKTYQYAPQYRPPSSAAPKGWRMVEGSVTKEQPFGAIEFDKPLSRKDINTYELKPLDPADPINVMKRHAATREEVISKLEANDSIAYETRSGQKRVMSEDTRKPGSYRITMLGEDGIPSGHIEYKDLSEALDEVSREFKQKIDVNQQPKTAQISTQPAQAMPEAAPSADKYEAIQKEISDLTRSRIDTRAKHDRIVDLEREAEFHKPAAIARAQAEIDARKAAPEVKPQAEELKPSRVDPYQVAERAVAQGVDRQSAYSRYVQEWGLRGSPLELDAKDFGKIYDNVKKSGPRPMADILRGEKGQINIPGRPPPLPGEPVEVGKGRLIRAGLTEESSKTLSKTMGAEGGEMARLAKAVRNDAELEANTAKNTVNKTLKGLTPEQQNNLVDVLEGKAKPIDAKVQSAFTAARTELDKVGARAQQVGLEIKNPVTGEKVPFQPRKNYFPHMFEQELGDVIKDPFARSKLKEQIKNQMESSGQGAMKGVTDKQVEQALNAMLKASRNREGHLEIARVFDLGGYSRDPGVVINKHLTDAYRRIQIAEKFKPDLSKGEELLTTIGQNHGNRAEQFARQYFQRVTGTEPVNRLAHEAVNTAVNLNNFSLLGQAAIANASQPTYTAILAGVKNTAKGYAKALTPEGRDFASKILGTSAKEFMEDVSAAAGKSTSGKMADVVLKYTGFNAVERMNRIVSANAGRAYAEATFEKLLANPKHAGFRETLQKMNVDVEGALKRGALSEADTLKAGQNIVNRTQFKTDVTELPLFWSSEAGRLLTQYKKFQFKSGQFVKDEILKEVGKGNILPLARAAAIAPAAGAAVLSARDAIRLGKQRDEDKGLADYLAAVGTFGAFSDAFAGSGRQPVRGLQYLAGPTLGRAGQLWEAGMAITREGDLRPLAKVAASSVPVVGPSIRQLFNKDQEKSPHTKMLEDLGIDTKRPSKAKLLEELGINR